MANMMGPHFAEVSGNLKYTNLQNVFCVQYLLNICLCQTLLETMPTITVTSLLPFLSDNSDVFGYASLEIVCRRPQIPKAIFVFGFGPLYTYKDSIVVNCEEGYSLRGSSLLYCEANNEWYPSVPSCISSEYGLRQSSNIWIENYPDIQVWHADRHKPTRLPIIILR